MDPGVPCSGCNVAIGHLGDDSERARALLSYLARCEFLLEAAGRMAERRVALSGGVKKRKAVGVIDGLDSYVRERWDLPLDFASPRLPVVPRAFARNLTDLAHSFLERLDVSPGIMWAGISPDDVLHPTTGVPFGRALLRLQDRS